MLTLFVQALLLRTLVAGSSTDPINCEDGYYNDAIINCSAVIDCELDNSLTCHNIKDKYPIGTVHPLWTEIAAVTAELCNNPKGNPDCHRCTMESAIHSFPISYLDRRRKNGYSDLACITDTKGACSSHFNRDGCLARPECGWVFRKGLTTRQIGGCYKITADPGENLMDIGDSKCNGINEEEDCAAVGEGCFLCADLPGHLSVLNGCRSAVAAADISATDCKLAAKSTSTTVSITNSLTVSSGSSTSDVLRDSSSSSESSKSFELRQMSQASYFIPLFILTWITFLQF